jgi:hypothetical protein
MNDFYEEFGRDNDKFNTFTEDKILLKFDKPHILYTSSHFIPSLQDCPGEKFRDIMNIKVGKKM